MTQHRQEEDELSSQGVGVGAQEDVGDHGDETVRQV